MIKILNYTQLLTKEDKLITFYHSTEGLIKHWVLEGEEGVEFDKDKGIAFCSINFSEMMKGLPNLTIYEGLIEYENGENPCLGSKPLGELWEDVGVSMRNIWEAIKHILIFNYNPRYSLEFRSKMIVEQHQDKLVDKYNNLKKGAQNGIKR